MKHWLRLADHQSHARSSCVAHTTRGRDRFYFARPLNIRSLYEDVRSVDKLNSDLPTPSPAIEHRQYRGRFAGLAHSLQWRTAPRTAPSKPYLDCSTQSTAQKHPPIVLQLIDG